MKAQQSGQLRKFARGLRVMPVKVGGAMCGGTALHGIYVTCTSHHGRSQWPKASPVIENPERIGH